MKFPHNLSKEGLLNLFQIEPLLYPPRVKRAALFLHKANGESDLGTESFPFCGFSFQNHFSEVRKVLVMSRVPSFASSKVEAVLSMPEAHSSLECEVQPIRFGAKTGRKEKIFGSL